MGVPGRADESLLRIGLFWILTGPDWLAVGMSSPPHPASIRVQASTDAPVRIDRMPPTGRGVMTLRGSMPHNRRSPSGDDRPFPVRRTGDRR